jgi:hypothetical protein
MEKLITLELSKNVSSEHIPNSAFSNPLSTVPLFNLFNTMSPIEKNIKNNIDDDGWDKKMEIDNKTRETDIYN